MPLVPGGGNPQAAGVAAQPVHGVGIALDASHCRNLTYHYLGPYQVNYWLGSLLSVHLPRKEIHDHASGIETKACQKDFKKTVLKCPDELDT